MGSLPISGGWVRLEVPAALVGLEGTAVDGMAFTLYDGRATWDRAGMVKANGGKPHAVVGMTNGWQFQYDANGNMITRTQWGATWAQTWDVDNHAAQMTSSGGATATFVYDGDGKRVKRIENGITTTVFIGSIYEKNLSSGVTTTYYFAGGKPIAQRRGGTLYFLQGDHLGSVSLTTDASGTPVLQARYTAFGGTRSPWVGTPVADDEAVAFTAQLADRADGWIYYYGARVYDVYLNRWLSPDPIVPDPGNPQSLNRYSY